MSLPVDIFFNLHHDLLNIVYEYVDPVCVSVLKTNVRLTINELESIAYYNVDWAYTLYDKLRPSWQIVNCLAKNDLPIEKMRNVISRLSSKQSLAEILTAGRLDVADLLIDLNLYQLSSFYPRPEVMCEYNPLIQSYLINKGIKFFQHVDEKTGGFYWHIAGKLDTKYVKKIIQLEPPNSLLHRLRELPPEKTLPAAIQAKVTDTKIIEYLLTGYNPEFCIFYELLREEIFFCWQDKLKEAGITCQQKDFRKCMKLPSVGIELDNIINEFANDKNKFRIMIRSYNGWKV